MGETIEIESALLEIPEYNYSSCNIEISSYEQTKFLFVDFFKNFMLKNQPCLIRNVTFDWKCAKKWVDNDNINYDYLSNAYGTLEAPVADCNNIKYNAHCKSDMKVSEYMQYLQCQDDRILYLKDWHLKRIRPNDHFYEIPSFFALDWLNEYAVDKREDDYMFVYIGPKGSWTPLHEDVYRSYSWSVNVVGKKKWILFPPGEEDKLRDTFGNLPLIFNTHKYKNIKYFEVVQEKGDALFIPSGWHHQVENEMNTVSINHNWINACNINIVWQALQFNLQQVEHQIEDLKDTPEFHTDCQNMLKPLFGMDFKDFFTFLRFIAEKRLKQLEGESKQGLSKYSLGINVIKFDLKQILNVMNSIISHPVFINVLSSIEDDFMHIKNVIALNLS